MKHLKNVTQVLILSLILSSAVLCSNNAYACSSCGCTPKHSHQPTEKLCGCGEVKGSENCCNPDAAKCGSCGKIKGSPGCCAHDDAHE